MSRSGKNRSGRRLRAGRGVAKLLAGALVLLSATSGCAFFASSYAPNLALAELEEELGRVATITETDRWILLEPKQPRDSDVGAEAGADAGVGEAANAGVVFYPGGKVEPRAYLPLLTRIVAEGYPVYLVRMPLDLAVLDIDRALSAIASRPEVQYWHLVGHSLGGAMAAELVDREPGTFASLTLLSSYPAGGVDLSGRDLPVLSAYGTRDGVADLNAVQEAIHQFPEDSTFLAIAGGNHAGFGVYGPQEDDKPATISAAEQRAVAQRAMLELFQRAEE
ncbi:MAG: hypothetical protein GVY29_04135 [Spirochaetes bacterium]|jgi:dienelactone hydrolase|nr:hypothetical protein [Spirochaetota bacterium]